MKTLPQSPRIFKILLALSLFFTANRFLYGQGNIYLGFELGSKYERYIYSDPAGQLYTGSVFYGLLPQFKVDYEVNDVISLGTGLGINDYGYSGRLHKTELFYGASNAMLSLEIPARIYITPFSREGKRSKANFGVFGGFRLAINTDYPSYGASTSGLKNSGDPYVHTKVYNDRKAIYSLGEAGFFFELFFNPDLAFTFSGNYVIGFNKVVELEMDYRSAANSTVQHATAYSNGNYNGLYLGLKFRLNRFWEKPY
ncbi:MAG: hypothetical protein GY705_20505 [Bacteroidetes bacterium]|nr:hypothetical protein [Bacteroidota bacterium]